MKVSKFSLFRNILLASAALAVPSSQQGAPIGRRQENHQLQPVESSALSDRDLSPAPLIYWAGARFTSDSINEDFGAVNGTFTVPSVTSSGVDDCGVTIYVGWDSNVDAKTDPCFAALQVGVQARVTRNVPLYNVVLLYTNAVLNQVNSYAVPAQSGINVGDVIAVSITQPGPYDPVTVTIEDQTTGWEYSRSINSTGFCRDDVAWAVGAYGGVSVIPSMDSTEIAFGSVGGGASTLGLANFGTVTFTHAVATDLKPVDHNPLNANTVSDFAYANGTALTLTSTGEDSLVIRYLAG